MKLIIAVINNDDSAEVTEALTREGHRVTKLSTTGGFLLTGNTTLLIGAQPDQVENVRDIIAAHSSTRVKRVPTFDSFGRGLGAADVDVTANVKGATIFVLNTQNSDSKIEKTEDEK